MQQTIQPIIKKRGTLPGSKKKSYSIEFRRKVIKYYDALENRSMADTAKHFDISVSTFKSFNRIKEKLMSMTDGDGRDRIRDAYFKSLEADLLSFVTLARQSRLPVTGEVIQTKARMLREKHGISEESFKASKGWLEKFLRRHAIRSVRLHGEAGQVNVQDVREPMLAFCNTLAKYDPSHIYNQDESALVYQLLPNVSYLAPEESRKEARGVKAMKAKNRVTFTVCTNADASHILDCMVIGKSKRPNAFDLAEPSDQVEKLYCSQRNAWMDGMLFAHYLEKLWYPAVRRRTTANVCMICDNCSAHGKTLPKLQGVEYVFLPPNVTSIYQPMDQGIIAAVKRHSRARLLQQTIEALPDREALRLLGKQQRAGTAGLKYGFGAHVLDAMRLLRYGMSKLTKRTVINCWLRSGILNTVHRGKMHSILGEPGQLIYVRTPGIEAEEIARASRSAEMEIKSMPEVSESPWNTNAHLQSDERQREDINLFNDQLRTLRVQSDLAGETIGPELDAAINNWIEEIEEGDVGPSEISVRDPDAIIAAVESLQNEAVIEQNELAVRRAERETVLQREEDKTASEGTYERLCENEEWLRTVVADARTRGVGPAILARLVDVLRQAAQAKRQAAPASKQTTLVDFFTRRT